MVLIAALLPGCTKRHEQGSRSDGPGPYNSGPARAWHGPPRQLKRSELTEAEQKYGIAPIPDSTVTYQPDVMVVGGGAAAIRSQNPNGFMWTIDADAPRARDLAPGQVFFMTDRAVGRVLDVRKDGPDLVVTVGPVTLTEIFRVAHIHIKDMPIDFDEAIAHTSAELPGQVVSAALPRPQDSVMPAMFVPDSGWGLYKVQAAPGSAPPVPAAPDVSKLLEKNFKTRPTVGKSGIGLRVTADGGGLKVSAETLVHLATPTLDVNLEIDNGIKEASIELKGAAGLTWNFAVGSDVGMRANVNAILSPDTDFSIPVGGIGPAPVSVTVRQRFLIKTALGVRDSTLSATGDYGFNGGFRVGYFNKSWGIGGPIGFTSNTSMVRSGTGISMAVTGLNLANQIKIIAGVGIHGFAAGPYFTFTTAVGAFRNSDIGMLACNGATLNISMNGGVGYLIPKSITNLINSVLSALNIRYRITGEGGIEPSEALTIINKTSQFGGCKPLEDTSAKGSMSGPV
jgi:hypothetical protein